MKKIGASILGVLLLSGCSPFEYHPYEIRLDSEYEDINSRNIEIIKILDKDQERDTVHFVFMGDTQRWYDETELFVNAVNQRDDIDFVVHGGDISDFGMKNEFCWVHDIMSGLKVPYVAIIGNHDNLGSGEEIYKAMYGALNFSFIFGRIKFVCLNTNALEYDYSVPVPDFDFIKEQIADTLDNRYSQTVAMMHVQPGDIEFNNNVQEHFQESLKKMKNLRFCVHAHAHALMVNDFFQDGIIYYGSDAMKRRNYLLFTVTKDSYSYEVVYF